jgi:hypothetical protein
VVVEVVVVVKVRQFLLFVRVEEAAAVETD